jgi:hypothetical protein
VSGSHVGTACLAAVSRSGPAQQPSHFLGCDGWCAGQLPACQAAARSRQPRPLGLKVLLPQPVGAGSRSHRHSHLHDSS